jgi:transposase
VAEENTTEKLAQLERKIEALERENERLRQLLEEALRAAKRQAAPFSRQKPKAQPQRPGRKAGKQ